MGEAGRGGGTHIMQVRSNYDKLSTNLISDWASSCTLTIMKANTCSITTTFSIISRNIPRESFLFDNELKEIPIFVSLTYLSRE